MQWIVSVQYEPGTRLVVSDGRQQSTRSDRHVRVVPAVNCSRSHQDRAAWCPRSGRSRDCDVTRTCCAVAHKRTRTGISNVIGDVRKHMQTWNIGLFWPIQPGQNLTLYFWLRV